MNAIALEFTMVVSAWLLIAVVFDRIDALRRSWTARRAIARRLNYKPNTLSRTITPAKPTTNPPTIINTRVIAEPLGV